VYCIYLYFAAFVIVPSYTVLIFIIISFLEPSTYQLFFSLLSAVSFTKDTVQSHCMLNYVRYEVLTVVKMSGVLLSCATVSEEHTVSIFRSELCSY
jgi:hypothetical protein